MARLVGPEDGSRLAYQIRADNALGVASGLVATIYSNSGGTTLADILTTGGAAITGSQVTVSATSLLPLFQFPDGIDTLYASVNGGPVTPIYARVTSGGGAVASVNGHTGVVVLASADVGADASGAASAALATAEAYTDAGLASKAPLASPTFTGSVTGVSKAMVGLGNVDNTADTGKPVSTAQQTALNLKANLAGPTFTGTVAGITNTMVGAAATSHSHAESDVTSLVADLALKARYRGSWAASTAYLTNDVVTFGGGAFIATAGFTSSTAFALTNWANLAATIGVYNVLWYGAKGDGSTDDTAAINAAITAAFNAGVANGSNYAEVYFPPLNYVVSGSLTQGGATKGNALIPLPVVATTAQKFTLVLRGGVDAAGLWYFQQTTVQTSGAATLVTTVNGGNAADATFGEASVIGGPTPAQGYGRATPLFSNMNLVISGIRIVVPSDPHICGIDLAGVANCDVISAGVFANATPSTVVAASQAWTFGLRMPDNNNNDYCQIGRYSCEGLNYGIILNEHTVAETITCIYCIAGVEVGRGGDTAHGSIVKYLSAEACTVGIGAVLGGQFTKVTVQLLDFEGSGFGGGTFAVFNDPTNILLGSAHYTNVGQTHLQYQPGGGNNGVRGCANFRVFDDTWQAGDLAGSTPAVAATGVAVQNPVFNNVMVVVSGGTVTNIAVNAVNQGITSGAVFLGPGQTIAWVGSAAPTWKWTLL